MAVGSSPTVRSARGRGAPHSCVGQPGPASSNKSHFFGGNCHICRGNKSRRPPNAEFRPTSSARARVHRCCGAQLRNRTLERSFTCVDGSLSEGFTGAVAGGSGGAPSKHAGLAHGTATRPGKGDSRAAGRGRLYGDKSAGLNRYQCCVITSPRIIGVPVLEIT